MKEKVTTKFLSKTLRVNKRSDDEFSLEFFVDADISNDDLTEPIKDIFKELDMYDPEKVFVYVLHSTGSACGDSWTTLKLWKDKKEYISLEDVHRMVREELQ